MKRYGNGDSYVCNLTSILLLTFFSSCQPPSFDAIRPEVIGGEQAAVGAWPWQAAMKNAGNPHCGGSLLNAEWVLTAGHCVDGQSTSNFTIILGEHQSSVNDGYEQVLTPQEFIPHPQYNSSEIYNDVALIRLATPATFNERVQPISLATGDDGPGQNSWVTGWGNTYPGSPSADVLMQAMLPVRPNSDCDAAPNLSRDLKPVEVCAGYLNGTSGGCHGDSGGPLVVQRASGDYELIGAVSWGQGYYCSTYTVFARVSSFVSWIQQTMGQSSAPSANFSYSTDELTAFFVDQSTDDSAIESWQWSFGDGQTATASNPTHTYAAAGSYTVTLTVTDDEGLSDSISKSVSVSIADDSQAVYNPTYRTPACVAKVASCDSGLLLDGRANLGPEANAPNTVNGSCADGGSGKYHEDESIDRIKVYTNSGEEFSAGSQVTIEVTVWAWTTPSADFLDLYYISQRSCQFTQLDPYRHLSTGREWPTSDHGQLFTSGG